MRKLVFALFVGLSVIVMIGAPVMSRADVLVNGDFSAGLTGWKTTVVPGSFGDIFLTTGGTAPASGFAIDSNGTQYAVTDSYGGPGEYILSQSFSVEGGVNIQYDFFAQEQADGPYCSTLDPFSGPSVQCARVSVLDASNNIVATLYQGADCVGNFGGCLAPFQHYNFNLNLAPGTYTLAFEEADNQFFFQMGVDNVSVTATPEPGSLFLLGSGLALVGRKLRKRFSA